MAKGRKYDKGKRDPVAEWDIPLETIHSKDYWLNIRAKMPYEHHIIGAARAMAFGAEKYDWANWKLVENAVYRYAGAALRHFDYKEFYWEEKEHHPFDAESTLHHWDHSCACIAFILWFLEEEGS